VITGDHPHSYVNNVTLFGKPRAAYAITQIQSQIGHVSPEIFNAFPRKYHQGAMTGRDVIASGFESIFYRRSVTAKQNEQLQHLVTDFGVSTTTLSQLFAEMDADQQSLLLFLRALVKKPKLLILDEPFAGMNASTIENCRSYIDSCLDPEQAVILVTHYDEEKPSSVQHTLQLAEGRVVTQS